MFIHVYMAHNLWNFLVTYKKYLLVALVTILFMLALITLFGPTNNNSDLLSKKQIKQLKTEKARLLELSKRQMDSVIFYKNAADNLSGVIDSSKTVTIYIKSEKWHPLQVLRPRHKNDMIGAASEHVLGLYFWLDYISAAAAAAEEAPVPPPPPHKARPTPPPDASP